MSAHRENGNSIAEMVRNALAFYGSLLDSIDKIAAQGYSTSDLEKYAAEKRAELVDLAAMLDKLAAAEEDETRMGHYLALAASIRAVLR